MKILHVIDGMPPETMGGAGRIALILAKKQMNDGHTVSILTTRKHPKEEVLEGVRTISIGKHPLRWAGYASVFSRRRARMIMDCIDQEKPDMIHAHSIHYQMGWKWIHFAKNAGKTVILTCHDPLAVRWGKVTGMERAPALGELLLYKWQYNPLRTSFSKQAANRCDRIISVSDALGAYLTSHGLKQVTTVHNGIDPVFWKSDSSKTEARQLLKVPPALPLFLLAGRLGESKGTTLAARVLPETAGILLAGNVAENISHHFRKHAWSFVHQSSEQMRVLFTACDAVIVPSQYLDPFPTVCLEAMAMERPVLATSWGGAKESVIDGETGWIIDPFDETGWRSRMEWCAHHPTELERMGKAGRLRIEQHFTIERMADDVMKIYEDVLTKRSAD